MPPAHILPPRPTPSAAQANCALVGSRLPARTIRGQGPGLGLPLCAGLVFPNFLQIANGREFSQSALLQIRPPTDTASHLLFLGSLNPDMDFRELGKDLNTASTLGRGEGEGGRVASGGGWREVEPQRASIGGRAARDPRRLGPAPAKQGV